MRENTSHITEQAMFRSPEPIVFWNKLFAFSFFALMLCTFSLNAETVDASKAELVAKNFFANKFSERSAEDLSVTSSFTAKGENSTNESLYHTFNFKNGGFVIIAADDRYDPIIGFSNKSEILENNNNESLKTFLQGHKIQLEAIKAGKLQVDKQAKASKWEALIANKNVNNSYKSTVVGPLTTTTWGQEKYYNKDCPPDAAAVPENNGRTYTGCVTVAMTQIMKYHNWPNQGNGYKYYQSYPYGLQYANYGETTYEWDQMPDNITSENANIAELMFHAATSIVSFFSTSYTGAFVVDVPKAFVYHFGYDSDIKEVYRASNSTGTSFTQIIKNELDDSRPVMMTGFENTNFDISHVWVIDGYDDNGAEDYYRMNWGWNGLANGWFLDNGEYYENQDPTDYDITYYSNQQMIYNIKPGQGCEPIRRNDIRVNYITETTADVTVMNYSYSDVIGQSGIDNKEIRYKISGSNDPWVVLPIDPTTDLYQITGMQEGTTYEVQARYECDNYGWSEYSVSYFFTTQGFSCAPVYTSAITFGGIGETSAYVYVPQPFEPKNKQVRYRAQGTTAWTETAADDLHYTSISGLLPGTTYEVQVRHECEDGVWTDYSDSATFTTTGDATGGCEAPAVTEVANDTYYIYFFSASGPDWNKTQFRWRPSGSNDAWTETSASVRYYRRVKGVGITFGQTVDLQLRVQCTDGTWSEYSDTHTFTSQDNL